MTVLEFTNELDGAINAFTSGNLNGEGFKIKVLKTILQVANTNLETNNSDTFAVEFLRSKFKVPSDGEHTATFYRVSDLVVYIYQETNTQLNIKTVGRALLKLGAESEFYRMPYERLPSRGYWLESIK